MSSKILIFSGSCRQGSLNNLLASCAAQEIEKQGGASKLISLKDYELPLYNEEVKEKGIPKQALALHQLMSEADGVILSTPEYNGSISPLLKNTIDWISVSGQKGEFVFRKKTFGLMSASPGSFGAMKAMMHLEDIMLHLGSFVMPIKLGVSFGGKAFSEEGDLVESRHQKMLTQLCQTVLHCAEKL